MGLKEYIFGFNAENLACEYLQKLGFEILSRNFHSRFGEIDIIAKKDEILHFVEVKATNGEYETQYRLTKSKFEKILKTINFFMMKENFSNEFQIDFLGISKNSVNFIENISANL